MHRFQTRSLKVFLQLQEHWGKIKNHPVFWLAVFVFCVVLVGVLWADPAWAQTATTKEPNWVEKLAGGIADLALWLAQGVNKILLLLISIVIAIMQYNSFATSSVVATGWVIVRDIMNIFFVMVLIIIAMGTIFGATSRFKWQQQVPRLMLFALLINFSRTICGIMIDFGQVIMLTFANALKDIAAGNFIQMFGIADFYRYSSTGASANLGFSNYESLLGALMTLFVMVAVTITMGILVLILVYRIVMLWILVVLSPLAFFLGGAKDLFGKSGYEKWWTQFKCAVVIGPVIAFFLWLTLSVAGSGSVAITEGFTTAAASSSNPADMLTKIFERGNFISLLIGLGMLYAGFDAASSFCDSGSLFSGMIGRAKGAVTTAAKWTAGGAAGLAILGTRQGLSAVQSAGAGAGKAAAGIGSAAVTGATAGLVASDSRLARATGKLLRTPTKQGRADLARDVAAGTKSKTLAGLAGGYADTLDKKVAGDYIEAGKGLEGASRQTKLDYLDSIARGGKPTLPGEQKKAAMAFSQIMGDQKALNELEKKGQLKGLYEMFGQDVENISAADDSVADRFSAFKESRPDLTGDMDKIDSSNIGKVAVGAFASGALTNSLMGMKPPAGAKKDIKSMHQYIAEGYMGAAKQKALLEGKAGMLAGATGEELAKMPVDHIADSINVEMIEKSPGMVMNVMQSQSPKVQNAINNMSPEVQNRLLRASAGITRDGQVEDANKLKTFISKGGNLGNIPTAAFKQPVVASAVAQNMRGKDWTKAMSQIQKDPAANKQLRDNLKEISSEIGEGNYGNEAVASAALFDREMRALDARKVSAAETRREQEDKTRTAAGGGGERQTMATEAMSARAAQARLEQIDQRLNELSNTVRQEFQAAQQLRDQAAEAAARGDQALASDLTDQARERQLAYERLEGEMASLNREAQTTEERT